MGRRISLCLSQMVWTSPACSNYPPSWICQKHTWPNGWVSASGFEKSLTLYHKKILGNLPGVIPSASFLHSYCNSSFAPLHKLPGCPRFQGAVCVPVQNRDHVPVPSISCQFPVWGSSVLLSFMASTTPIFVLPSKASKKCELSWQWPSEGISNLPLCSLLWSISVVHTWPSPVTPSHCSQFWNLPRLFLFHTHFFILTFSVFSSPLWS